LVEPGFNSGWVQAQGMSSSSINNNIEPEDENNRDFVSSNLVEFDEKGKYSDPEFVWSITLGPNAIVFLHSDKLGEQYQNDIFVASIVTGNIHHFDLNQDRTQFVLTGELED
jgi:aldose sugar dehydrogenase